MLSGVGTGRGVRSFFSVAESANGWVRLGGGGGDWSRTRRTRRVRRHRGGFARTCWASRDPRFTSTSVMVRNSSSVSASVCLSARVAGANPLARRVGTTTTAACRAAGACAAARLSARAPRAHHAVPLRSVAAVAFIVLERYIRDPRLRRLSPVTASLLIGDNGELVDAPSTHRRASAAEIGHQKDKKCRHQTCCGL